MYSKTNILFPSQHGFKSGHSTAMAVIDMQDKITQTTENDYSIKTNLT